MPTNIEWYHETISPLPGCTKISETCLNCPALRRASLLKNHPKYHGLVEHGNWTGRLNWWPADLEKPLRWKRPRRILVNRMGDLFHQAVDIDGQVYDSVMHMVRSCPQHTFLFLTKRPEKMRWVCERLWGNDLPDNAWFGVTAENQKRADKRIPILLQIPAAVRWVSVEPMLGPVDVSKWLFHEDCDHYGCDENCQVGLNPPYAGINWIVCGGESGPNARPMHPGWVRSLRDQCVSAGVPFLFKGWGELAPIDLPGQPTDRVLKIGPAHDGRFWRVGKKVTGCELDGRTWDQYPVIE